MCIISGVTKTLNAIAIIILVIIIMVLGKIWFLQYLDQPNDILSQLVFALSEPEIPKYCISI